MAGPSGGRRALGVIALTLMALGLATLGLSLPPVRAVDAPPPEPGIRLLDGPSLDGLVADLDRDGRNELIRLTGSADSGNVLAVEVWKERRSRWESMGTVALQRAPSLAELVGQGPGGPRRSMLLADITDGARLLRWRLDGKERALVVVNHLPGGVSEPACCLTGWEVDLDANGATRLRQRFAMQIGGRSVLAFDGDADGTDELLVRADGEQGPEIRLLHWNGHAFDDSWVRQDPGDPGTPVLLGDTDGRPGQEAALAGTFQSGTSAGVYSLMRVAMRDGRIHVEQEELDRPGWALGTPAPDGGAPLIAYGNDASDMALLVWPSDGQPRIVASANLHGQPIAVLGSGAGERIVVRSVKDLVARYALVDATLAAASIREIPASPAAASLRDDAFAPYAGPWPNAAGGAEGFVVAGRMLTVDATGGLAVGDPVAAISGSTPLGPVGQGDEIALLQTVEGDAFEPAGLPHDWGGDLLISQSRRIAIVPAVQLSAPELDGGRLTPGVDDAVRDPSVQDGSALLIEVPAFVATLDAPVGSIVRTNAGAPGPIKILAPETVTTAPAGIGGPSFRAEVVWASRNKSGKPFTATLSLVTPSGHTYHASWQVRLLPARPQVTAEGALFSLGVGAGISGQVGPGSTVTVDGRAVQTDASGRFETMVPGGILPKDVTVVATDPFRHSTVIHVSVVAPIDYRRLPWLPIVVIGMIGAGVAFLRRQPRLGGVASAARERVPGEPALEEIDGDRI